MNFRDAKIAQLSADHQRAWSEGRYFECAAIIQQLIVLRGTKPRILFDRRDDDQKDFDEEAEGSMR